MSALIQSRSAAGKSTLQDAILSLIPDEDYIKYTRVTDQALFYKEEDSLINKILAIEEAEGMGGAAYSIRNIQSAKKITVAAIGKSAAKYLREYLENIRPRYAKKKPKQRKLFLTETGDPVNGNSIRTSLFHYKKAAGIKKTASPHSFRRSCATHLLQQGADIRYVQKLLGHSHIKTTQIYTRVYPVDLKETHSRTHPGL